MVQVASQQHTVWFCVRCNKQVEGSELCPLCGRDKEGLTPERRRRRRPRGEIAGVAMAPRHNKVRRRREWASPFEGEVTPGTTVHFRTLRE